MGRWGAVREGSNSSELPLFPPSPKPPPQAPRPLRPPIQPCQAALPLPLVKPHLTPGGGVGEGRRCYALASLRPWPALSQDLFLPRAEELRAGRPHSRGGLGPDSKDAWGQAGARPTPPGHQVARKKVNGEE